MPFSSGLGLPECGAQPGKQRHGEKQISGR
jgi:hypothetical protein